MSTKTLIWIMVTVFSLIGGFVPALWGDSMFSAWGILTSTLGGFLGIWVGMKLGDIMGN